MLEDSTIVSNFCQRENEGNAECRMQDEHGAASRNRIRNCPQMTQMHADGENGSSEFTICVNLRHLRAEVFSYSLRVDWDGGDFIL
jgi:hypothetical protein